MSAGSKILIVDDEESVVSVLQVLLCREGHQVHTAEDGKLALEALGRERYDLMITDIRMDRMDGLALLPEALRLHPDMPVIIMTAYAEVATAKTAMDNGAFDYLPKPFKLEQLWAAINRAFAYKNSRLDAVRGVSMKTFLRDKERDSLMYVLNEFGGNEQRAAAALGISVTTLRRKVS